MTCRDGNVTMEAIVSNNISSEEGNADDITRRV
jgi:hypothetical protein